MTPTKPRVAWVVSSPTPYKMPFFELLAQDEELDVHFLFCTWDSATRPWKLAESDAINATVDHGWKIPIPGRNKDYIRVNPKIIRAIAGQPWDLVVVAGYNHPTMLAAILTCIARRIPFIVQGESHLLHPRGRLKRAVKRTCLFPLLRRAAAALATGTAARRYWEHIGIPSDRIFICANTPDIDYFRTESARHVDRRAEIRRELGIAEDAIVGIFVGRLIRVKGVDIALQGLAQLEPVDRPQLLIVGDGPERKALEEAAARDSLPVRFAGFRQQPELPPLYAASDFFVLPSRVEPWGVVVNEAMAAGLPAVLSDQVGAAYDLLEEGNNGHLVVGTSSNAWSDALGQCVVEQNSLEAMGQRSQSIVAEWTHEASVEQFLSAVRVALPN